MGRLSIEGNGHHLFMIFMCHLGYAASKESGLELGQQHLDHGEASSETNGEPLVIGRPALGDEVFWIFLRLDVRSELDFGQCHHVQFLVQS